ncbi:ABC transporter permease [Pseudoflavitalea rhizosphaerae]|uniref:ABC transporter permease n=1 Tax=Pseudoflavitalea rhizosphaerae TaxID=1884793 RepID=UPI000F8E5849|nr:ABC transporter permease [Pseudoflavitalea rhizosphaerae]
MLKNYFIVAIRNLTRNKVFSVINIVGLALGLTCSLLIMLWVLDERSMDQFHVNKDRLFSVYEKQYFDNKVQGGFSTPGPLARELKQILPEVEYSASIGWEDQTTFQLGDKILQMTGSYSDSDFFKMYSFPLLEGTAQSALADPLSLAISRKMATAFFGSAQAAIGKTLRADDRRDFKITAVYENMPKNSTAKWDYIINWNYLMETQDWIKQWDNNGPRTTLLLHKNADPAKVEAKIKNYMDQHLGKDGGWRVELYLMKFSDRYLYGNVRDGVVSGGRIEYVRLFSLIAVFILLIACINFMNLTTARSIKRSREIGVRKVVGAVRFGLVRQFLGEAIVVAGIAMIVALILLFLSLPLFNQLTEKQIAFPFADRTFWACILGLLLITGLLSGSYPALFLSSFKPIVVLKGVLKVSSSANWFRKGLVVFQFSLSSLLIIGTIIISQQVRYIQNKNLGYNRENIVKVALLGEPEKYYPLFKQQVGQLPGVSSITRAEQDPVLIGNSTIGVDWEGKEPNSKPLFTQIGVGYDFVKTMQMTMLEGRDFSKAYGTDTAGFILNETAVKKTGYTNPVGKPFTFWGTKGTIIGVVKDFHFNTMHEPINAMVMHLRENVNWGNALVRVEGSKTQSVLKSMEEINKQINPKFPFTYEFADEEFRKTYASETMIEKLSNCFAGLAIIISCLGLLGLAMFAAEQRVREIGIRKVLGAGLGNLFGLLSREFLLLVFIAILIACPLAWWAMNNWLQDFEYRISMNAWPFVIAGIAALAIALFTISFQTVKAALANPVKSLRSE